MLMPRKTKYRKAFKGKIHGDSPQGSYLSYGMFGLQALEPDRITARQIESARRAITRYLKRMGRVWIRVFPDIPVTSKPAEVRMGSGKGSVDYWCCRVAPGRILFEIDAGSLELAKEAFRLGAAKLPVATRVITRSMRGE